MPRYHLSESNPDQLSEAFSVSYEPVDSDLPVGNQVMGVIQYGKSTVIDPGQPVKINVGVPCIGERKFREVWTSKESTSQHTYNDIHYSINNYAIFGNFLVDESDFPDLEKATYFAYKKIIDMLDNQGYPRLLRIWNYFPDINKTVDSIERYRMFCVGRHHAMNVSSKTEKLLPAASAIGTHSPGLLISFIAAKDPGVQIENPKQVSAFHYPSTYGPKSPSFSRAILKNWGKHSHLYISGTASIVGHATTHVNDVTSQFNQTVDNLQSLLENTQWEDINNDNRVKLSSINDISLWKIFIRNPQDIDNIQSLAQQILGPEAPIIFLQGDICRAELTLEIEGVYI